MLINYSAADDAVFAAICRDRGWRRTAQRRAVYRSLCGNREHPTVEALWGRVRREVPDVSLDSVYRILGDFADAGLVRRLDGAKVTRYDADTGEHGHFVCTRCGSMVDFGGLEAEGVAARCGEFGRVDSVELTVHGLCRRCQEKDAGAIAK